MAKKAPNKQTQSKPLSNETVLRGTPWVRFLTDVSSVTRVLNDDGDKVREFIPLDEQTKDMVAPRYKRRIHKKGSRRQMSRVMADGLGLVHDVHYKLTDKNPILEIGGGS